MKKLLVLAVGSLLATPILADWSPTFERGEFRGTITYNGIAKTVVEPMTSNGYSNGGSMSELAHAVYALPYQAKAALDAEIRELANSTPGASTSYVSSSISGPIRISLSGLGGQYAGLNRASVSGLNYTATIRASTRRYGLSIECYATLSVRNVTATLAYAPYSGIISSDPALSRVQLSPSTNASCSNSLDFVPIIGDLISGFAERKIASTSTNLLNNFAATALRNIIPMGPQYLGLYRAISPGQYVISGVDVGAYLQNNFATFFTGRELTFTLGPELVINPVFGVAEPNSEGPFIGNAVAVNFSDQNTQINFSIQDIRYVRWRHLCPYRSGAQVGCVEP